MSSNLAANPAAPQRLVSLDAYRGFIMIMMASAGLAVSTYVSKAEEAGEPLSAAWHFLAFQTDHVPWVGCSFWDLIQPSFMFMVGVALPYSVASRIARGDGFGQRLLSASWRTLLLVLLAVFLSSPMRLSPGHTTTGPTTHWTFTNVLAQIGLGYVFVFLLVGRGLAVQLGAVAAILALYTLYFGLYPLSPPPPEWVATEPGWQPFTGWFAHWDKNNNAAHFFDVWLLNLFPRAEPFVFNEGGYETLNFVPSMATMALGVVAGEKLRGAGTGPNKVLWLAAAGALCLGLGLALGEWVCPIVKRIWTPSWAVYSAGWTFLMLAAFYAVIDVGGLKAWSYPLVVVGMNSIAAYVLAQQLSGWLRPHLWTHLGRGAVPAAAQPTVERAATLAAIWLVCWWMYRRRLFLRL